MKDKGIAVCIGVGSLTVLGITALIMGVDGVLLGGCMAGIGVLVGYMFGKKG